MNRRLNTKFRNICSDYKVFHWEVADYIGVSASTLSRRLRLQLDDAYEEFLCMCVRKVHKKKLKEGYGEKVANYEGMSRIID